MYFIYSFWRSGLSNPDVMAIAQINRAHASRDRNGECLRFSDVAGNNAL